MQKNAKRSANHLGHILFTKFLPVFPELGRRDSRDFLERGIECRKAVESRIDRKVFQKASVPTVSTGFRP